LRDLNPTGFVRNKLWFIEEKDMWEGGLLPVGSVVLLKGATRKIMIVGICQGLKEEGDVLYDYSGLLHPYGYMDRNTIFLFNHEQIVEVCSVGYMDDEFFAARGAVEELLVKVRSGELSVHDLKEARLPKPEVLPVEE
jgi:hypothetical protein